jgi:Xaa-Pro aminopeptidase
MARTISVEERSERVGKGFLEPLPPGVWEDRMRRCREAMATRDVQALLVYSAGYAVGGYEWVRYFANYIDSAPLWASETWLAIPLDGEPTLWVTWKVMVERAADYSPVRDIRFLDVWSHPDGDRHELVAPALAAYIAEQGLRGQRIAFGHGGRGGSWMGYTPGSVERTVERACGDATLIDGAELLWEITSVKTEYDIAMLRRVAEVNCEAIAAALAVLREGTGEYELFAAKIARAAELGAEIADPEHAQLAVIHPGGLRPFYVTSYRFKRGDMFTIDSGASMGGYESDIARNAVIGLPSREQRRTYEVCMEIARMLEEALRPGVVACELWELKEREAKKAGFVRTQPFAGHGVGLSKHEPPHLAPWDRTVIQESMVVNLEPGLFAPPDACFTYEETYVIRADGLERITPLSSELYVA